MGISGLKMPRSTVEDLNALARSGMLSTLAMLLKLGMLTRDQCEDFARDYTAATVMHPTLGVTNWVHPTMKDGVPYKMDLLNGVTSG